MWTTACVDRGVLRGRDALGQGRYLEAIATLDEAVSRLAGAERPIKDLASAHRAQAGVLISAGNCAEAAQHIARADALTQPILVDHQGLFRCMETKETPPDVRQRAMERLVELGESRGPILRELVVALLDQGREADALKGRPQRGNGLLCKRRITDDWASVSRKRVSMQRPSRICTSTCAAIRRIPWFA